ncbi:hypothetical protein ABCR94_38795 [Streptomyces sp. 21So2-11]|uniref:hypothetical protein n=1 Tax=Streptomyces sp. 21So2-11 TaxID=3144408 RepID=UPI00321B5D64
MSTRIIFPSAAPVTVLLDPADDVAVTRAALAAHHLPAGHVTVHPAPAVRSQTLGFDILAALGKPAELPGNWGKEGPPVWNTAAAWILALPVARLLVLRAHLLDAECWSRLLVLRKRTGVHLVAFCHTRRPPAVMRTALRHVEHHTVSTGDAPGHLLDPAPEIAPPRRNGEGRWITVPALAYLAFHQDLPTCRCTPGPAGHPYVPERAYAIDQVVHRLATRTAVPQLAAALAIAVATGASASQLSTVHYSHLDPDATTLTLHDPFRTRRHGFTAGCGTYTVPPWARPFLLAAANLLHLSPRDGSLLAGPQHTLPALTAFAEHCRLRPPQPTPPRRKKKHKAAAPPPVQWYDGILPPTPQRPTYEFGTYEKWLHEAVRHTGLPASRRTSRRTRP